MDFNIEKVSKFLKEKAISNYTYLLTLFDIEKCTLEEIQVLLKNNTIIVSQLIEIPNFLGEFKVTFPIKSPYLKDSTIDISNLLDINRNKLIKDFKDIESIFSYKYDTVVEVNEILTMYDEIKIVPPIEIKKFKDEINTFCKSSKNLKVRFLDTSPQNLMGEFYDSNSKTVLEFHLNLYNEDEDEGSFIFEFNKVNKYISDLEINATKLSIHLTMIEQFFEDKNDFINPSHSWFSIKESVKLYNWIDSKSYVSINLYYDMEVTEYWSIPLVVQFEFPYCPDVKVIIQFADNNITELVTYFIDECETLNISSIEDLIEKFDNLYNNLEVLNKRLP